MGTGGPFQLRLYRTK